MFLKTGEVRLITEITKKQLKLGSVVGSQYTDIP